MRVVVGSAIKTETPLFVGQLRDLELDPYWNISRSILEKDILPKLGRNRAYLRQNGMETVPPVASAANLEAGRARAPAPGPKNALGVDKFAMLNPMDIYLHSTRRAKCSSAAGATYRTAAFGSSIRLQWRSMSLANSVNGTLTLSRTRYSQGPPGTFI